MFHPFSAAFRKKTFASASSMMNISGIGALLSNAAKIRRALAQRKHHGGTTTTAFVHHRISFP